MPTYLATMYTPNPNPISHLYSLLTLLHTEHFLSNLLYWCRVKDHLRNTLAHPNTPHEHIHTHLQFPFPSLRMFFFFFLSFLDIRKMSPVKLYGSFWTRFTIFPIFSQVSSRIFFSSFPYQWNVICKSLRMNSDTFHYLSYLFTGFKLHIFILFFLLSISEKFHLQNTSNQDWGVSLLFPSFHIGFKWHILILFFLFWY